MNDVYEAVRSALQELHGDYTIGSAHNLPSLTVKYLSTDTNIVLIRCKRAINKLVLSSIFFIKQIGQEDAFLRTLHVAGTIRSCRKFLIAFHKKRLPLLLQECKTDEEKTQVKQAIVNSFRECKEIKGLLERKENEKLQNKKT